MLLLFHPEHALAACFINSSGASNGSCQTGSAQVSANGAACIAGAGNGVSGFGWIAPYQVNFNSSSGTTTVEIASLDCIGAASTQYEYYDETYSQQLTIASINGVPYTGSAGNVASFPAPGWEAVGCSIVQSGSSGTCYGHQQVCGTPPAGYSLLEPCSTSYSNYNASNLQPNQWTYEETDISLNNADFTQPGTYVLNEVAGAYLCSALPAGCGATNLITFQVQIQVGDPPTLTSAASCSARDVSGSVNGNGTPGPYTISWSSSDGRSGTTTADASNNYTIDMSPDDQLTSYTVSATLTWPGSGTTTANPSPNPVTYGPCYTASCGTVTLTNVVAGQTTIPVTVTATITPLSGAPPALADLTTIGVSTATMTDAFNGVAGYNPSSGANTSSLSNHVDAPAGNGLYPITWTFKDTTAGISLNCIKNGIPSEYAPYFQVNGGDVEAGSTFNASNGNCTDPSGTDGIVAYNQNTAPAYSGAGTQLAAQALAQIVGFVTNQTTTTTLPSNLALSNTSANVNLGSDQYGANYGYATCPPSLSPKGNETPITSGTLDLSLNPGGSYVDHSDLTITNSALPIIAGSHYTIYVYGNVTITSTLDYSTAGWLSPSLIPSIEVVAIGGNIYINPAVSELDGIYIAEPSSASGGAIYTCSDTLGRYVTGGPCNSQLTVVGSFIAKNVELQRGYGNIYNTSSVTEAPAETLYYTPEMWVDSTTPNSTTYDSIASLPPIL